MGCFRFRSSPKKSKPSSSSNQEHPQAKTLKKEAFLTIPSCTVHLMERGEAMEHPVSGKFTLLMILDQDVPLAIVIKVGDDLQWPLTKDEPVVKLDSLHYLFTLPVKDGDPLSYGVTFLEKYRASMGSLDKFLTEHSCFSASSATSSKDKHIDWKEFAPRIEDYNNVLASAIAEEAGKIVGGTFKCSNAYTNQVHKVGEMIISCAAESNTDTYSKYDKNGNSSTKRESAIIRSLERARKVSKMIDKISRTMLNGVQFAAGPAMILATAPGEVLLASFDAVNKVLDAAEDAEKQAPSETSKTIATAVGERLGGIAEEATEDGLATAGHYAGTASNVSKTGKATNPATSASSGVPKSAPKVKKANSAKF